MEPVLDAKGQPLVCAVEIELTIVYFQAWRVNVGRNPVYLLDANRPENAQHFRDLTAACLRRRQHHAHHAGNAAGHRRRAAAARAGCPASVFHMNEGHAAFLTLELIREKMAAGQTFAEACATTKARMHFHHPHAGRGRPRPFQP